MPTWRPIRGAITRLDTSLASNDDIESFLERERIIARQHTEGDTYWIEMAATGRRRRVAVLDDETGEIVPGASLADVVEKMDFEIRKLQIEIGGQVAWGDIDLGEVDVSFDDIEELPVSADDEAVEDLEDDEAEQAEPPSFEEGPMLIVARTSLSQLPGLAAQIERPVAAFAHDGANVMLADVEMPRKAAFGQADFSITFSADPAGLENPKLTVVQDGARLSWHWTYDKTDCRWVRDSQEASAFAEEHLGAGAFVTRICADLPNTDAAALRDALIGSGAAAPRAFVGALGLPEEVADCLQELLEARQVPGATVFEPRALKDRIKSTVAYEVAGQGVVKPEMWEVIRKLYLNNRRALAGVAGAQAAVGAGILGFGLRGLARSSGGRMATVLGSAVMGSAAARVLIANLVSKAIEDEGLDLRS